MFEHPLTGQAHLLRAHFADATDLRDCDHTDCLKIGVHSHEFAKPEGEHLSETVLLAHTPLNERGDRFRK